MATFRNVASDLLPGLKQWLKPHSDKLEGDISMNFDTRDYLLQVYNIDTKKLVKKRLTLLDIENGEFPTKTQEAIKEALGEG